MRKTNNNDPEKSLPKDTAERRRFVDFVQIIYVRKTSCSTYLFLLNLVATTDRQTVY